MGDRRARREGEHFGEGWLEFLFASVNKFQTLPDLGIVRNARYGEEVSAELIEFAKQLSRVIILPRISASLSQGGDQELLTIKPAWGRGNALSFTNSKRPPVA